MPRTRSVINLASAPTSKAATLKSKSKPTLAVVQQNTKQASKRSLDGESKNPKAEKRPAFGDITNAVVAEKVSLKSQVKRGLSSIVVPLKRKPSVEINSKKKSKSKEVTLLAEESRSLPSSQEEFASFKTEVRDEEASIYESAEESSVNEEVWKKRYQAPARQVPPEGVDDFDLENWSDVFQCSEYAMDIFNYYKSREQQFRCPDYMSQQPYINESMRSILVDWMVEVQESFELNHETLYTAVKMLDLYLSRVTVQKEELQLLGATACLIACKVDERIPPLLDDFVYVCDDAYSKREITAKEREMIRVVAFDVGYPLSYRFLRRFARVCKVNMPVLTLARYILEMSLSDYRFNVGTSESKLAAAALVLALKINHMAGWANTLQFYSGYSVQELAQFVLDLLQMLKQQHKDSVKTIRQKYSHKIFHRVALIDIPESIDLLDP